MRSPFAAFQYHSLYYNLIEMWLPIDPMFVAAFVVAFYLIATQHFAEAAMEQFLQQLVFYILMLVYASSLLQKTGILPILIIILCYLVLSMVFYLALGPALLKEPTPPLNCAISWICTI